MEALNHPLEHNMGRPPPKPSEYNGFDLGPKYRDWVEIPSEVLRETIRKLDEINIRLKKNQQRNAFLIRQNSAPSVAVSENSTETNLASSGAAEEEPSGYPKENVT